MDEDKPTPEEETPPEEAAPTLAEAVTAEPVEEAPTPEEAPEPEPAVEEQPVVPQYSEAQVRSLIGAALKNASTNREKTEFEGKMEALYEDDPAQWARVRKAEEKLTTERATAKEEVSREYYEQVFGALLPQYRELLSNLSQAEKAELNPDNPKYQDDAQYLAALLTTIASKSGEQQAEAILRSQVMDKVEQAAGVVEGHERTGPPDLGGAEVSEPTTVYTGSPLAVALKETVGAGMEDDDYSD